MSWVMLCLLRKLLNLGNNKQVEQSFNADEDFSTTKC